jgi:dTDP-4-amino-4,6-dideoxygalactose transaminase
MQYLNKKDLAYYSGAKVIKKKFKEYNSIGTEELNAVKKVIKSVKLSYFIGGDLEGGFYVQKFEKYLENFYKVKHAVTVNSWTSGLICAVGALDIDPGDEIITSPWSMCASATSILHWNAIPVFADINKKDFCIDPQSIKDKISKKTKAILAVDIFGRSCQIDEIKKITRGTNIKIITDSAQSPFSFYKNKVTLCNINSINSIMLLLIKKNIYLYF